MMKKLCFATHNMGKVKEAKELLKAEFIVVGLTDVGIREPIAETADTIAGNACLKVKYVFDNFGMACFSDDSGLEVEALGGAPGVYSARYAGEQKDTEANIDLLLKNMEGVTNRRAQFVTVIAYISDEGEISTYEGAVKGVITNERRGREGFGYDPVFVPDGYEETFGELPLSVKNIISHRARAIRNFVAGLDIETNMGKA